MIDHNIIDYACISKKEEMQAFANMDYVSNLVDWKSICEYVFTISGGTICFNSIKQRFVAGFITEAEYIALSLVFCQVIWTCHFVFCIEGISINLAIPLLFDNNKALL